MSPRVQVFDPDETCDGAAKKDMGECRMDITNSELGYLGYDDSESYGLSWKVCSSALWRFIDSRRLPEASEVSACA